MLIFGSGEANAIRERDLNKTAFYNPLWTGFKKATSKRDFVFSLDNDDYEHLMEMIGIEIGLIETKLWI